MKTTSPKQIQRLLKVQNSMKPYITIEQARRVLGYASKSTTHARLNELVRDGKAEHVITNHVVHYHIKETQS